MMHEPPAEPERESGYGSCSARLQAGTLEPSTCHTEGGRETMRLAVVTKRSKRAALDVNARFLNGIVLNMGVLYKEEL